MLTHAVIVIVAISMSGVTGVSQARTVVRLNQVGVPRGQSASAFVLSSTARRTTPYRLVRTNGGSTVRRGRLGRRSGRWNRHLAIHRLRFGSLRDGRYRIRVGRARSAVLRIGNPRSLYRPLFGNTVTFLQSQRDGADVIPGQLRRRPSHLLDGSATVYAPPQFNGGGALRGGLTAVGGPVDVSGGWFDAGDYLKFVETASYDDAVLLMAVRDHLSRFPRPSAAFAEARFGTDWLLRMWDPATQTLYAQVGVGDGNNSTLGDHDLWRLPQADDSSGADPGDPDYFVSHRPVFRAAPSGAPISPNLAGRTAAAFGLCAQVFADADPAYAGRCAAAGEQVFDLARTEDVGGLTSTFPHDFYPEDGWRDDLEFGATELARARTSLGGDPGPRQIEAARWAKAGLAHPQPDSLNLYDTSALAHTELSEITSDQGFRRKLAGGLRRQLVDARSRSRQDPFGLAWEIADGDVVPHALGVVVTADLYRSLTGSTEFAGMARRNLDWVLGANPWGESFIVGAGSRFPNCMQSQIANLSGSLNGRRPLQLGATVSGPASTGELKGLGTPGGARKCPGGRDGQSAFRPYDGRGVRFVDDVRSWATVEPTGDYGALAMLAFAARTGNRR